MRIFKFLIALFLLPVCLYAQQEKIVTVDYVTAELVRSIRRASAEKILLTTDKQIYVAGEVLRLKALLTDAVNNKLTLKTKLLYADLVDDNDSIYARVLLNAGDLKTSGHMVLDNFLTTGFYWVRAYTRSMITANPENIGIVPIYIFNKAGAAPVKKDMHQPVETGNKININIFPEGGHLISGTDNMVALQAINNAGKPLTITGIIKNAKGATIAKFSTNNNGLAKFTISPSWYGSYGVFVQQGDTYDSITSLPKVNLFAAQLAVQQQEVAAWSEVSQAMAIAGQQIQSALNIPLARVFSSVI